MFDSLTDVVERAIDHSVSLLDGFDLLLSKSSAVQSHAIDTAVLDGLASGNDIGRNVLVDLAATLDHHMLSDMGELMHEGAATDDGVVLYHYLTRQLYGVGHDDIVVQDAIVRHMAVRHNEAIASDNGFALAERTTMNGSALADGGVVSDDGEGLFAVELKVLRDGSYDCRGEDTAVLADSGTMHDAGIGHNDRTGSDFHIIFDIGKGTNLCSWVNLSRRIDVSEFVYHNSPNIKFLN